MEIFQNVKIWPHSCAKYFVYLLLTLQLTQLTYSIICGISCRYALSLMGGWFCFQSTFKLRWQLSHFWLPDLKCTSVAATVARRYTAAIWKNKTNARRLASANTRSRVIIRAVKIWARYAARRTSSVLDSVKTFFSANVQLALLRHMKKSYYLFEQWGPVIGML